MQRFLEEIIAWDRSLEPGSGVHLFPCTDTPQSRPRDDSKDRKLRGGEQGDSTADKDLTLHIGHI